ncbi:hypothetical protein NP83_02685 [Neobacillus niacini]|nr:hypothetical protein NP83_02685 [Neobacillus niacini]
MKCPQCGVLRTKRMRWREDLSSMRGLEDKTDEVARGMSSMRGLEDKTHEVERGNVLNAVS